MPTLKLFAAPATDELAGKTKTWPGGETIILVIGNEDSPAMQWLADAIFGVSAKTFLAKIKQDVFKGDVPHPLSANDDAGTLKRVQSGLGVLGLVSDAAAKSLPAGVAVIAVEWARGGAREGRCARRLRRPWTSAAVRGGSLCAVLRSPGDPVKLVPKLAGGDHRQS